MLSLLLALAVTPGVLPGDYCDLPGGQSTTWTREQRRQTFDRAEAVTDALGTSAIIAAYHQELIQRESRGRASVEHNYGFDSDGTPEHGLGAYGLSIRWHSDKLDGGGDPGFCSPEISAVVAAEIMHRAWTNYGARTVLELQSVYSGRWDCTSQNRCVFTLSWKKRRDLCARMRDRGFDCHQELKHSDLGERLDPEDRRPWALAAARQWLSSSPLAR